MVTNPFEAAPDQVNSTSQQQTAGLIGSNMPSIYNPTTQTVSPNQTVQGQVDSILAGDGPLMQRARSLALEEMNKRGLVNSSIAIGAAQGALIDRALPIAQQDANTYWNTDVNNMSAINRALEFNAGARNQFGLQGNEFAFQRGENALGREFTATQNALDRQSQLDLQTAMQKWQTGERLSTQEFNALQAALQRSFVTSERVGTQQFSAEQAALDRQHQIDLQNAIQKWQTGERLSTQEYNALQAEIQRQWQGEQNTLSLEQQQAQFEAAQSQQASQFSQTLTQQQQQFLAQQEQQWKMQTEQNAFELEKMGYQLQLNQQLIPPQFAANVTTNTMSQVNAVLADPNLSPEAKTQAIANIVNYTNSTLSWAESFYGTNIPDVTVPTSGTTSTTSTAPATTSTATSPTVTTSPTAATTYDGNTTSYYGSGDYPSWAY